MLSRSNFSDYTIMVVDDSEDFLDALNEVNKARGREKGYNFAFCFYSDYREALYELKLNREKYDMLILDYQFEGYTAIEFISELREFNEDLYVLLLTAKSDPVQISSAKFAVERDSSRYESPASVIVELDIQGFCSKVFTGNSNGDVSGFVGFYDHLLQLICSALTCVDIQDRLKLEYREVINILRNTVEAKSEYTLQHSSRVAEYAVGTYKLLRGYTDGHPELELLKNACFFHDIGKIKIPDDILNKTESLTEEEYCKIKTHVLEGVKILEGVLFKDVRRVIAQHHERLDGSGYPYGLKEKEIDELAKVIAVTDAFDAMTSGRQYMSPKSPEDAFDELMRLSREEYRDLPGRDERGKIIYSYQYDRKIVETLNKYFDDKNEEGGNN